MTDRNNAGRALTSGEIVSMDEFDRLPAALRKVLAEAPFDFATHGLLPLIKERGIEHVLAIATKNIPLYVRRHAESDYGPSHPQCGGDGETAREEK